MRVLPIVPKKLTSLRGISSVDRSRRRNLNHLQRLRFANGEFILQEPESASYGKICYVESMKQLKLWTPLSIFDGCGTPLRVLNGACPACCMGLDYKFFRDDLDGHTYHLMNVLVCCWTNLHRICSRGFCCVPIFKGCWGLEHPTSIPAILLVGMIPVRYAPSRLQIPLR